MNPLKVWTSFNTLIQGIGTASSDGVIDLVELLDIVKALIVDLDVNIKIKVK